MNYYLPESMYVDYFGQHKSKVLLSFLSENEIEAVIKAEPSYAKKSLMRGRLSAYQDMRRRIVDFTNRLNKDIFILHPDLIDSQELDLREYYHLADENTAGLSTSDLINGYTLGLCTLDELRRFKGKYGTTNVQEIFSKSGLV